MAPKKTGLGKGLDSLIPSNNTSKKTTTENKEAVNNKETTTGEIMVDINRVEPNREQPRTQFDEEALKELADSIKQFGVISPLIVYDKGKYLEIIAGERRWRAARMAGIREIPVIIRNYSDIERAQIALIENIQRENLNPIEEAVAYKKLIDEFKLKQEDVADRVSKSRAYITNSMRLLKLCDGVRDMVIEGLLSTGHARALVAVTSAKEQLKLAEYVAAKNLSVRQTEELLRNRNKETKPAKKPNTRSDAIISDMENKLRDKIGTKVTVNAKSKGKGRIEIEYYSEEDLERIYDMLLSVRGN